MQEYTLRSEHATTIALDQHARSVTLAALYLATGEARTGRIANCPTAEWSVDWARWATEPIRFVCESGPCGFQLAGEIRAMGINYDVIAVISIPRSTEDRRLKDDRGDARSMLERGSLGVLAATLARAKQRHEALPQQAAAVSHGARPPGAALARSA